MATTVHSQQLFQPAALNRAGIRRLKLADAALCQILQTGVPGSLSILAGNLTPLVDALTWYEFVFPTDQSCGLQIQMQTTVSGAVYYSQSIAFTVPHVMETVVSWAHASQQMRWLAVAEDWNGLVYLLGHPDRGLIRSMQAGTGASIRDRNSQSFGLTSEQLVPYYTLPSYEDSILFPEAGFTYGFSLGFNS